MKTTIISLILVIISLSSAQATQSDERFVTRIASEGKAIIKRKARSCKKSKLKDRLGERGRHFCVRQYKLNSLVEREVEGMRLYELSNESDYDSRITRLYAFRQDSFHPSKKLSKKKVSALFQGFGVSKIRLNKVSVERFNGDHNYDFYLHLTDGVDGSEDSSTLNFINQSIDNKRVLELKFEEGIELYPGGGFYVTHYILLMKGRMIYFKYSWWNS